MISGSRVSVIALLSLTSGLLVWPDHVFGNPEFDVESTFVGIVGGQDTTPGQYPWQISIQYSDGTTYNHFCGGTLIDVDWVVTAAHCFATEYRATDSGVRVVAGVYDLSETDSANQQPKDVVNFILHENFSSYTLVNDIALVQVSEAFQLNDYVQLLSLPSAYQETSGSAVVTGWGATSPNGDYAGVLQQLNLPIISDDDCSNAFGTGVIIQNMICAGDGSAGKGPCQGDSGGPLVSYSQPDPYFAGIVSWGKGCGAEQFPSVFTEVSYFVDWINVNKQ